MTDTILLRPYPANLLDLVNGEFAIDPAGRRLGVLTGEIPLDRELLPEPILDQPDWVYKWGGSQITIGPLPAGGGGRPNSGGSWQTPGIAVLSVNTINVAGSLEAEIEIQRDCEITRLGTLPQSAGGFDYGIRSKAGFTGITLTGGGGSNTATTSLLAEAGRYTVFVEPLSMTPFRCVRGAPALGQIQDVPVFMELSL